MKLQQAIYPVKLLFQALANYSLKKPRRLGEQGFSIRIWAVRFPGKPERRDQLLSPGPKPGQKEGPSKDGKEEMPLSREQAGWLLDGFRPGDRRLPMGPDAKAEPKDPNRPTW